MGDGCGREGQLRLLPQGIRRSRRETQRCGRRPARGAFLARTFLRLSQLLGFPLFLFAFTPCGRWRRPSLSSSWHATVRIRAEMPCNLPLSPSFVDSVVDNGGIVGKSVFKLAASADCIKKRQGRCNGVTEFASMISATYAKALKCGWNSCQAFFRAAPSFRDSSRKSGSAALTRAAATGGAAPLHPYVLTCRRGCDNW